MKPFLSDDFLLQTETAKALFHDFAKEMPIYDYHCHLPVEEIARNLKFNNLTHIWLNGDHYKWRAMRANGIEERFITGDATDFEKFEAWAATVPKTLRNPLYHWTHMELKDPFGITGKLLDSSTAKEIYDQCSEMLQEDSFSAQGLLNRMNVKVVCTTDDPTDPLLYHQSLQQKPDFTTKVCPTFRPDNAMAVEAPNVFHNWLEKLEACVDTEITTYSKFLEALQKRHDFFHEVGCRLADHGIEQPYAAHYFDSEISLIFMKARKKKELSAKEVVQFKSAVLYELTSMNAEKKWTQQFHFGAVRNANTRMMKQIGPNTGYDTIGDFEIAKPLAKLLDGLEQKGKLTKTILYNLNPRDNELIGALIGVFQDGSIPGKIQFGSGWWFNDQKDGMERQINALSNMGLLSLFIGMLTDSRSFLSYPRHEYFRRILCNLIGNDVENGELPNDRQLLGDMVRDICFNNAEKYFQL